VPCRKARHALPSPVTASRHRNEQRRQPEQHAHARHVGGGGQEYARCPWQDRRPVFSRSSAPGAEDAADDAAADHGEQHHGAQHDRAGRVLAVATTYMPSAATNPTMAPFREPSSASVSTSTLPAAGFQFAQGESAQGDASAWQPVFPDWPASTGRNMARITSRSMVPEHADHGAGNE